MIDYTDFIEIDAHRMLGKPTIKGTRITVEMILEDLAAQKSMEEIISAYPHLTEEAISAALTFAADAIKGDKVYPIFTG